MFVDQSNWLDECHSSVSWGVVEGKDELRDDLQAKYGMNVVHIKGDGFLHVIGKRSM